MSEGRKIYSLLVKDESGVFYRIKIDGNYYNTLAGVDAYTLGFLSKNDFCEGISYNYKLNIQSAFIAYKKDGHTKVLRPIFNDKDDLGFVANEFKHVSEIDLKDADSYEKYPITCLKIKQLASNLLSAYQNNDFVRKVFDRQGGFLVKEALFESNLKKLERSLSRYRELRKVKLLYENALLGKEVKVFPEIIDGLLDMDIKPIEERRLEIVDSKIAEVSKKVDTKDQTLRRIYTDELNELYSEKEELEENLGQDNNEVKGQIRLF